MHFIEGNIYHVYNRGNKQQPIFFSRENYLFFLNKMRNGISPYGEFLSYCLRPNHFHWLVRAKAEAEIHRTTLSHPMNGQSLNKAIGVLLRSYTRAIQIQEGITESLFQQKTKAKEVLSLNNLVALPSAMSLHNSFFFCFNYIHQNPWKAGLVNRLEEWEFSSFRDYAGIRKGTLCHQKLGLDLLGIKSRKEFLKVSYEVIDKEMLDIIF